MFEKIVKVQFVKSLIGICELYCVIVCGLGLC